MAGVPGAGLHRSQLPSACARATMPSRRPKTRSMPAARGSTLRVPVLVDGDGELGAVGGRGERGRRGGVERGPGVGEQQRAQRLADGDRAREIVVGERLAGVGEPVLREPLRQLAGNGERLVAVFEVNGVHEGLDQGQLVGCGLRHNYLSSIDGDIITGVSKRQLLPRKDIPCTRFSQPASSTAVSNDRVSAARPAAAPRRDRKAAGPGHTEPGEVIIRRASAADAPALVRLAALDSDHHAGRLARRGRRRGRRDRRRGRRSSSRPRAWSTTASASPTRSARSAAHRQLLALRARQLGGGAPRPPAARA